MTNRLRTTSDIRLEGCLLVAAPHWSHKAFERTVCLIIQHSAAGAVGVVLNRGLPMEANGIWQHLTGGKQDPREGVIHLGGPHSGPVLALHNSNEHAEYQTGEGVYLAAEVKNLQALVTGPTECHVKIIVGKVDWKLGQLEREFAAGNWLPLPVSPEIVFADQHLMWPLALRRIGNQLVADITRARIPRSVLAN